MATLTTSGHGEGLPSQNGVEKVQHPAASLYYKVYALLMGLLILTVVMYYVDINKLGVFLQSRLLLNDQLSLQAGVRHEKIDSDSKQYIPTNEAMLSDLLAAYRVAYAPSSVAAGKVKHDATLFNLGAVYALNDAQQVFANASQGFSLPDIQRMLRDVQPGFVVNSANIEPIKVNNYELVNK
ncbi:MAG: TonB-dependent receptor [Flavobacteriales bacterium]|nr:MAG: TonB-dependent receptor [Flavobacteriales bacterium]